MSDYFAALMRASNLFSDGATSALDAPLEVVTEAPTSSEPSAPAPRPSTRETREAVATREMPAPTAQVAQPATAAPDHDDSSPTPSLRPDSLSHRQQAEPAAPGAEPQAPRVGIAPQERPPQPSRANDLVHAAMRWVASDPQLAEPARQAAEPLAAQPRIPDTGSTRVAPAQPVTRTAANPQRPQDAPDGVPAAPQVPAPAPVALPPLVVAPATPRTEGDAPRAATEEPLAISIGAIHLRVDAPAAQTQARPATPPAPAQRPAAPECPSRSGLSRRALRRL